MHGRDNCQYYILIEDHQILQGGSIWIEHEPISGDFVLVGKYEGDDTGQLVQIASNLLKQISYQETQILLAVPPPLENRLMVITDKSWIHDGLNIKVDNVVKINFPDIPEGAKGVVRYKGRLPGRNGIFFGVELDKEYSGKGTTNGIFRRKKMFTCDEDCGVFVSIFRIRLFYTLDKNNKIRPETEGGSTVKDTYFEEKNHKPYFKGDAANDTTHKKYKSNSIEMDRKLSCNSESIKSNSNEYNLKINERAVWMADDGPKFCTVLWIGTLPDSTDGKTVVGVEFDEPIGSGTGKYKGKQLFHAKRRHASLMPVLGLLRADVYMSMLVDEEHSYRGNVVESSDYGDFSIAQKHAFYSGGMEKPLNSQNERGIPTSLKYSEQVSNGDSALQTQLSHLNLKMNSRYNTRESQGHNTDATKYEDVNDSGISNSIIIQNSSRVNLDCPISNLRQQSNIHSHSPNNSAVSRPSTDFKINDHVVVSLGSEWFGIIRWLGTFPQSKHPDRIIAGVELNTVGPDVCTDGTFMRQRFFSCKPKHGLFIPLNKCSHVYEK